jgi:hypothetical protein
MRGLILCTVWHIILGDIIENKMFGAFADMGKGKWIKKCWSENVKGRDLLK